jgi:hypothetical protein
MPNGEPQSSANQPVMEQLLSAHTVAGKSQSRKSRKIRAFLSKIHGPRGSAVSPAPSEIDDPTSPEDLCSTCRSVDWSSVLRSSSSPPVRKVLQVNLLNPSACRFCNFLVQSLGTYPRLAEHDLLAVKIDPKLTPYSCTADAFVLGLVPKWDFGFRSILAFKSEVIFEVCEQVNHTLRPIQPLVDLTLFKFWLDHCAESHTHRCRPSGSQADDLHVIDCTSRQIIAHPISTAYITLSYVWGQTAEQHSEVLSATSVDQRCLPPQIPRTVEDALQVTLQLGYQYLWVDKYCLDHNSGNFHTQLKQMNRVYQNSVLTIIAAAGSDSSYGLPGVSRHRKSIPHVRVGDYTLSSIPHSIKLELDESTWATRGWTYQEGLLSTRRLIFTDNQVYYECQSDCLIEGNMEMPSSRSKDLISGDLIRNESRVFAADRTGSRDFDINYRIEEYSKRLLTNEEDILNAFLGIFELFHQRYDIQHLWGLPYPIQDLDVARFRSPVILPKIYFLLSLGWFSAKHSARRIAFPSWSWTGWFSPIDMIRRGYSWRDESKLVWGQPGYIVDDTDWSMHVEKADGTWVNWSSCEQIRELSFPSPAQTLRHDEIKQQDLSRFLRIVTYVSRILPFEGTDVRYSRIEVTASSTKSCWVYLSLDSREYSPSSHDLYVLHMPWQNCQWMIVIRQLEDCWERVGLAFQEAVRNVSVNGTFTFKKTRMEIRLG